MFYISELSFVVYLFVCVVVFCFCFFVIVFSVMLYIYMWVGISFSFLCMRYNLCGFFFCFVVFVLAVGYPFLCCLGCVVHVCGFSCVLLSVCCSIRVVCRLFCVLLPFC